MLRLLKCRLQDYDNLLRFVMVVKKRLSSKAVAVLMMVTESEF